MSSFVQMLALGSGSRGNAFAFHYRNSTILIDAGFSRRELCSRMLECNLAPAQLTAVLLTHEHDDHVKGCRVLCNELDIPLYATGITADRLRRQGGKLPDRVIEFEPGGSFEVGPFAISPFSVPHDAVDPVGFSIQAGTVRIGIATDLGRVNPMVANRLHNADALILESNYDDQMLMASERQIQLKRRIRGQFGHMNNLDAAASLAGLLGPRTRTVYFAHVSSECNTYELAEHTGRTALEALGRHDIHFAVVRQDRPLPAHTLHQTEEAAV